MQAMLMLTLMLNVVDNADPNAVDANADPKAADLNAVDNADPNAVDANADPNAVDDADPNAVDAQ
jgi:hypothetical protein